MDVFARFGRDARRVHARNTNNVLDLLRDALRLGGRQVDFVDDGRDLKVVLDRKIRIASVCASMPCDASTTRIAPSHAASERDTS